MQEEPLPVVKKQTEGSQVSSERKVSAVITISEADESPERAVQSILENRRFFADMHIVKFGYSTHADLYDGWADDLSELVAAGLELIWHSKLDPAKLKTQELLSTLSLNWWFPMGRSSRCSMISRRTQTAIVLPWS